MIKSLSIQNFQSHEKTKLEFSNGVNIIIGSSDSGKTSIIRSIRKVVWNRPAGDTMRSSWGGETKVRLQTEDGSITWLKDKVDKYILETDNIRKGNSRNTTEFKAFGTSVPEEISRFLNINEINLQQQLDSPFLLSETPGAVAAHFNKVAKLDKIDLATSNINSWIRQLTSDIKYAEEQESSLQEELKKFKHLEKFEVDVEVLEEMNKRLVKNCANYDKLGKLLTSYKTNKETILEYQEIFELEEPINNILSLIELRAEKDVEEVKLDKLICQIREIQTEIEQQNQIFTIETNVTYLLKLYKDKDKINNEYKQLYKLSNSIVHINRSIDIAKQKYNDLHNKFDKVFPIGSICPLCGKKK